MAAKDDFANHCAELFAPLGTVRIKRMFGGHGIYVDDVFIAIVTGETLYLKADDETAKLFEAEGCTAFSYQAKGRKRVSLGYWSAPADAKVSP